MERPEGIGLVVTVADAGAFLRRTNVLPLLDAPSHVRVDLIFSSTSYEMEAISHAGAVVLEGATVRFASAENLIIHTLVAGRPRDIEGVSGVLARNRSLDEAYLQRWLGSFFEIVKRGLISEFRALKEAMKPQSLP